jgi:hypothetical protein
MSGFGNVSMTPHCTVPSLSAEIESIYARDQVLLFRYGKIERQPGFLQDYPDGLYGLGVYKCSVLKCQCS